MFLVMSQLSFNNIGQYMATVSNSVKNLRTSGKLILLKTSIIMRPEPASMSNLILHSLPQVGMYMITVLVGLFIHLFLVLPGIYFGITKKNPFVLYKHMLPAAATAFGKPFVLLVNATIPRSQSNVKIVWLQFLRLCSYSYLTDLYRK